MILKETLRDIVKSQYAELNLSDIEVERELLNRIDLNSPHVTILSGIRRCGKGTLLLQIMQKMDSFSFKEMMRLNHLLNTAETAYCRNSCNIKA